MAMNNLPPLYPHPKSKNETLSLVHGIYAGSLFCALAIVWYLEYQQSTMPMIELAVLTVLMSLMFGFNVLACIQVKKGNNEGLILSRVMAVLIFAELSRWNSAGTVFTVESNSKAMGKVTVKNLLFI